MKEPIIQQCLDILKRDDVKSELKLFCRPVIQLIFDSIYLGLEFKINSINYYLLNFENPRIFILYLSDLTIYFNYKIVLISNYYYV